MTRTRREGCDAASRALESAQRNPPMIPPSTIRAKRAAPSQLADRHTVIDCSLAGGVDSVPPAEVLEHVADAAAAYEWMRRRGQEVRFRLGARPGAIQIELLDRLRGNVRTLTITEAFALA